jgi:hypothetical protein
MEDGKSGLKQHFTRRTTSKTIENVKSVAGHRHRITLLYNEIGGISDAQHRGLLRRLVARP